MNGPFVKYVAPSIGDVVGVIMLLSPCKAVWEIRKSQRMGDINPLPYPMTAVNCLAWVIYGAVIADPFITPANVIGLVAGIVFTMSTFPFCSQKMQELQMGIFVVAAAIFGMLSMVDTFALDKAGKRRLWGAVCVSVLMIYYVIPLSTMMQVVKHKDASSIYLPLACCSIVNGGMWTIYGLALGDINIWGPNSFGAVFGCVQVALRLFFGVNKKPADVIRGSSTADAGGDLDAVAQVSLPVWQQEDAVNDSKALLSSPMVA